MTTIKPQYIINKKGNRISMVIPVTEFESIMEKLEELDDIRLYDESKSDSELSIPIGNAFEIIEAKLKNKKISLD